jgi:hypothetical protein
MSLMKLLHVFRQSKITTSLSDVARHSFLPRPEEIAGRQLIMIDYVVTGEGLIAGADYVEHYYQLKGHPMKVHRLALKGDTGLAQFTADESLRLAGTRRELEKFLEFERTDDLAEFPPFYLGLTQSDQLTRNPEYDILTELIRRTIHERK